METDHVYTSGASRIWISICQRIRTQTWILLGITALLLITICYASDVVKSVAYHDRITTKFLSAFVEQFTPFRDEASTTKQILLLIWFSMIFVLQQYFDGTCVAPCWPIRWPNWFLERSARPKRDQIMAADSPNTTTRNDISLPTINTTTNSPKAHAFPAASRSRDREFIENLTRDFGCPALP